jgi:hypothetical protein
MKLETSLADLDSINIDPSFLKYDSELVLHLANSIVKMGGIIRIPIVKKTGIDSYEIISNLFEYQSFLKAREIDPNLPDRLRVFIMDKTNEDDLANQIEIINEVESFLNSSKDSSKNSYISIQIKNLFSTIEKLKADLSQLNENKFTEIYSLIDTKIPKNLSPLDAFNQINKPEVAQLINKKISFLRRDKRVYKSNSRCKIE